jgi:hypothetical protein
MKNHLLVLSFAALLTLSMAALPAVFKSLTQTGLHDLAQMSRSEAAGNRYFVSKNGNNGDGKSWATAWNELSNINWNSVLPGDIITIDGGQTTCPSNYNFANHASMRPGVSCGMQYNTALTIGKSGTESAPISIQLSSETGHNGTAVVFGGRSTALPYCQQSGYSQSGAPRPYGILIGDYHNNSYFEYVEIDGMKRSGIMVYGNEIGVGLRHDKNRFITLRNMEVFDNGQITNSNGIYDLDYPGVSFNGSNLTFDRMFVHDNGQDEFQDGYTGSANNGSHAALSSITLKNSWLYNNRDNPTYTGWPFNEGPGQTCVHNDGVQIWGGGLHQNGFIVDHTVFGPLLFQGFYPGDYGAAGFDNVVISDSLFINALGANINSDGNNAPTNWILKNITSYLTTASNPTVGSAHGGFDLTGSGHSLKDSISYYGYYSDQKSVTSSGGNIYYGGEALPGATNTNPLFTGPLPTTNSPVYSQLASIDLTPKCTACAGKGASLHSIQDLYNLIDTLNSNALSNTLPVSSTPPATPLAVTTPQPTVVPTSSPIVYATATAVSFVANTISFEAENGKLTAPFKVGGTSRKYIYQSKDTSNTGPLSGGKAQYSFNINTPGTYKIYMTFRAANDGQNSLYWNIDTEPQDATMLWDMPINSNYSTVPAAWRGTGTFDNNQYNPKEVYLSTGTHTLIIRGREANTRLDKISISK